MSQNPASAVFRGKCDLAELRAGNVFDAVILGQRGIEHREVRIDQREATEILFQNSAKELCRLLMHLRLEGLWKTRKVLRVDHDRVDAVQV